MSCVEVPENTGGGFGDARVVVQSVQDIFSGGDDVNFSSSLSSQEYDEIDCLSPEHPEPSELGDHEQIVIGRGSDEDDDIDIDIETVDTDNMADKIRFETVANSDEEDEYCNNINLPKRSNLPVTISLATVSSNSTSSAAEYSPVAVPASRKPVSSNLSENVKILNSYEVPAPQPSNIEAESIHDLLYRFENEYFSYPSANIADNNVTNEEMKEADMNPAIGVELDADLTLDTAETLDYSECGMLNLNTNGRDLLSVVLLDDNPVINEEEVTSEEIKGVFINKWNIKAEDHNYGLTESTAVPKITCLPALPKKVVMPVKMTSLLKPRTLTSVYSSTLTSKPSTHSKPNPGSKSHTLRQMSPLRIKEEVKSEKKKVLNKLPGYLTTLSGKFVKKMEDNTKNLVPREAIDNAHQATHGSHSPLRLDAEDVYTRLPSYCDEISQSKRFGVSNEEEEGLSYNPLSAKRKPSEKYSSHKHKHRMRRKYRDDNSDSSNSDSDESYRRSRLKPRHRSKRKLSRDSRSRSRTKKRRRRSTSCSSDASNYEPREHELDPKQIAHDKAVKERRVVYVGGIARGWTPHTLRQRFGIFGDIESSTVHFREAGDNFGFVTFKGTKEAFQAVEGGNQVLGPNYTLCFGGRRKFCKTDYADLDGCTAVKEEWAINEGVRSFDSPNDDFEKLLKNRLKQLKR